MSAFWQGILESDAYLLYQLSQKKQSLCFIKTEQSSIRETSFLDGRFKDYQAKKIFEVPLDYALEWHRSLAPGSYISRSIFHVSFCGSTLLSRALESDSSLTFKEPQALTDLESELRLQEKNGASGYPRKAILALAMSQFSKINSDIRYLVKPSNLMNAVAPEICELQNNGRAVFLSMSARNFLIAVLRGGSERVEYINRLHSNFGPYFPGYIRFRENLLSNSPNDLQTLCRSVLLAHAAQNLIFDDAARRMPRQNYYRMEYENLASNSLPELEKANLALDLGLSTDQLKQNIAESFVRHSKAQALSYDSMEASNVDQQVLDHYGSNIESALSWWAEQNFRILY